MSSSGGDYPEDHDIEDVVFERESSVSGADTALTEILADLRADYTDDQGICILELKECGEEVVNDLRRAATALGTHSPPEDIHNTINPLLNTLLHLADSQINHTKPNVPLCWRRTYTDARLLRSLTDLCYGPSPSSLLTLQSNPILQDKFWLDAVARLDMAIIVAGAPGEGRLDQITDLISLIQNEYIPVEDNFFESSPAAENNWQYIDESTRNAPPLPPPLPRTLPLPRLIPPPSVSAFRALHSLQPFVLPGFARHWDSVTCHPWSSPAYLLHAAGRGRIVPVEIGKDYRDSNWTQQMMDWEEFLGRIGFGYAEGRYLDLFTRPDTTTTPTCSPSSTNGSGKRTSEKEEEAKATVYLAQHNLLNQFPTLRYDVIVPDYVNCAPNPPPFFPLYKPPNNPEQMLLNVWVGPECASSPAHFDPYFNMYAQIVGRKTVWLAPPRFQSEMYPISSTQSMSNTSRIDVFAASNCPTTTSSNSKSPSIKSSAAKFFSSKSSSANKTTTTPTNEEFPLFFNTVLPNSFSVTLEQGDVLFIPPGWWHAMRAEERSFSVSMWF